jgi:hypothetical protein
MKMKSMKGLPLAMLIITTAVLSSCVSSLSTVTVPKVYNVPELKYILIARYTDLFWCDPDLYPIAQEGLEQQRANSQLPTIQANTQEFNAILRQLGLETKTNYPDVEKLLIYRQYKLLNYGLELTGTVSPYNFTLRTGKNQGFRILGTITTSGSIKEVSKETSFNTCPICLAKSTLIDTPLGPIPVEGLRQGMVVWTQDVSGEKIEATLIKTTRTPVTGNFLMIKLTLDDGRMITASPGHPTAENLPLESYGVNNNIDGSEIMEIEKIEYSQQFTYDILPLGQTGLYWANGILLKSTLVEK